MDTEVHRHRCEVRQILAWRGKFGLDWVKEWIAGVPKYRGQAASDRLRDDCRTQWAAGNRGAPGEWRTAPD